MCWLVGGRGEEEEGDDEGEEEKGRGAGGGRKGRARGLREDPEGDVGGSATQRVAAVRGIERGIRRRPVCVRDF